MKARPPELLCQLVAAGRWPRRAFEKAGPHVSPTVLARRVGRIAPGEDRIELHGPPFRTVRELVSRGEQFWTSPIASPSGIDLDLALVIGDFGPGSDSPICLDFRQDPGRPCVIRLRYRCWPQGEGRAVETRWVRMARDLETFVRDLGL